MKFRWFEYEGRPSLCSGDLQGILLREHIPSCQEESRKARTMVRAEWDRQRQHKGISMLIPR